MRTAGSISTGNGSLPPKGKYNCVVIGIDKGLSQQKKTPYIEPTLSTGEEDFTDQLYVTEKTIGRLCLFAKRVCGMPDDFSLSDDDKSAVNEIAKFIMENAIGKNCIVTIEENEEKFIPKTGPDIGRTITKMRRRVGFNGYAKPSEHGTIKTATDEDLPF